MTAHCPGFEVVVRGACAMVADCPGEGQAWCAVPDHSRAPVGEALSAHHQSGQPSFTPPGHEQASGADPCVRPYSATRCPSWTRWPSPARTTAVPPMAHWTKPRNSCPTRSARHTSRRSRRPPASRPVRRRPPPDRLRPAQALLPRDAFFGLRINPVEHDSRTLALRAAYASLPQGVFVPDSGAG